MSAPTTTPSGETYDQTVNTLGTLQDQLVDMAEALIRALPNFVIALLILAATWIAARFAVRSLVVGAVVLFGAALPDVETVVGLSGAIFMTMSIAILPPAFYLKLRPDGGNQYLDTFACAIIPIGLCVMFAGVVGQVDIIKQLVAKYPADLAWAVSTDDIEAAMSQGKVASMIGVESGHALGSSLAILRTLYELGVRYMTLTHGTSTTSTTCRRKEYIAVRQGRQQRRARLNYQRIISISVDYNFDISLRDQLLPGKYQ